MRERIEEWIESEIARIERRWRPLVRELGGAQPLAASWTFRRRTLRWHVALDDVLEPDVDIEVLPSVLVVRARAQSRGEVLLVGLLPVPEGFDAVGARIRTERGCLEVVVLRRGTGGRR